MKSTCFVFISLIMNYFCFAGNSDSTYFMVHEQTGLAKCENNLSSDLVRGAIRFKPGKSSVADCGLLPPTQSSFLTLSSVPVLSESRVDATHGKCDTIEDEALESTTKRPNPIGIGLDRPASDGHSSGATHSLSINLDSKYPLRFAQTEHEGANNLDSERTESKVNLDGGMESRHASRESLSDHDTLPATEERNTKWPPRENQDNSGSSAPPIQTPSIVEAFYSHNQRMLQDWKVGYDNSLFIDPNQAGFISPYFSLLRARNLIVP